MEKRLPARVRRYVPPPCSECGRMAVYVYKTDGPIRRLKCDHCGTTAKDADCTIVVQKSSA